MQDNLTLTVLIIDSSGSMQSRASDIVGSVKETIRLNKETEGESVFSIYSFSTGLTKLVDYVPVDEVGDINYRCCGGTALYDAVCGAIDDIGMKLALLDESKRPSLVQVMILTDGEENSSWKYKAADVKKRIEEQTSKYSWVFSYVGSNQDAILAGAQMGIGRGFCATYSDNNLKETVSLVSSKYSFARSVKSKGMGTDTVLNCMTFSDADRESIIK